MKKEMADLVFAQGGLKAELQIWKERYRDLQEQVSALEDSRAAMLDAQDVLRANCKQLHKRCERWDSQFPDRQPLHAGSGKCWEVASEQVFHLEFRKVDICKQPGSGRAVRYRQPPSQVL